VVFNVSELVTKRLGISVAEIFAPGRDTVGHYPEAATWITKTRDVADNHDPIAGAFYVSCCGRY
jgi:hypothetical protein